MKLKHPEKFNIPLAQKVLDHITVHPEMHNQAFVMDDCGTAGCIAGWAWVFHKGELMPMPMHGRGVANMEEAACILGIPTGESRQLFSANLGEPQARKMLASMIRQAGRRQLHDTRVAVKAARVAAKAEEKRQREIDAAARFQARVAAYAHTRSVHPAGRRLGRKSKTTL